MRLPSFIVTPKPANSGLEICFEVPHSEILKAGVVCGEGFSSFVVDARAFPFLRLQVKYRKQ